ncbi:hypothetical protein SAMN05518672_11494 [Chitinophaga sp. CF118]|uniref:hypothetical protein n=1 Tax=Chitinophaga sp. CF118 TaxID=1884367 RepID=UPI0008E24FFB|nr:hypothetical protein [Chitinophaga sp. CF118]SFF02408.1 hypothetical protein SAMN05518672_11494 [Chitinophaga sp. CF118]
MKKSLVFIGIAVTAVVLFVSGTSLGSACADDHHGLRGKCRITVVNGVYHYDCVTAIDPDVTDCTYYVE